MRCRDRDRDRDKDKDRDRDRDKDKVHKRRIKDILPLYMQYIKKY